MAPVPSSSLPFRVDGDRVPLDQFVVHPLEQGRHRRSLPVTHATPTS